MRLSNGGQRTGHAATRGPDTIASIAFVSPYPPQRCGVASFTADLAAAVGDSSIVALQPTEKTGFYPAEVGRRIARDKRAEYVSAAQWIDSRSFDVVSIQHEHESWGGRDGTYILDLARALQTPIVTTLHTVPERPRAPQQRMLIELLDSSAAVVVMSTAAAELLARSYGRKLEHVEIVPRGVPDLPLVDPETVKPQMGLVGKTVILSLGLVRPGKGYEAVIAAMPAVVRADPSAVYVIVGATHPETFSSEGETYRHRLEDLASSLRVGSHVRFVGRYVSTAELGLWLRTADIFVTPSPNLEQTVSGTLSLAMAAGKAIVSTPFAYASERLVEGRGRLAADASAEALADGIIELALSGALRAEHGQRAYDLSRSHRWPEVGSSYRQIFARVARPGATPTAPAATVGT